jgi:D-beta-D-heptose 7-phosphate kinase/D-beta-D-heptose 1-phosphate adenosyltransferase
MAKETGTIVIATGGFDPIHEGHIQYFIEAKKLALKHDPYGGKLWVGINSDQWLERKKGKAFQSYITRFSIIDNLKMVDNVFLFNDDDGTAIDAIKKVREECGPKVLIIFANGGDRTKFNIPEIEWVEKNDDMVKFEFGVGGTEKMNSSSNILKQWYRAN